MRNNFNLQLNELHEDLKKMGTLCEDCITFATQSLLLGDTEFGERAIQAEKQTDIMEKEIQNLCMRILLQQQPVASDLRTISAAIKVITDMERIGDQGSDIAELIKKTQIPFEAFNSHIAAMADCIIRMVTGSVESFIKQDAKLAKQIADLDDQADDLFIQIKNDILDMMSGKTKHDRAFGEKALNTLMIAKYLERIGDHAVNITECALMAAGAQNTQQE